MITYELTLVHPELLQKNNWTEPISIIVKSHHTLCDDKSVITFYLIIKFIN